MPDTSRHPAIEAFLADVDARLQRLPADRRVSERDELAQHLDLLVAAYRARGMHEDAAVRAATERFGRAELIGAVLHDAWHQRTRAYVRFFAAYAAFIVVAYLGLFWSLGDPLAPHLGWRIATHAGWLLAASAAILPPFIYPDVRKRRRAAETREGEHA